VVRFEDNQRDGDDTALNGLKISCKNPTTAQRVWVTVSEGIWGNWKNEIVHDNYVAGA
jgi:hypothetical protein